MKALRDNGLTLLFLALMFGSLVGEAIVGLHVERHELAAHGEASVTVWQYLASSSFGANVLENWQSEFLAVAAMSIFTVYLRQHGSPESKRLDAPNHANEPTY